MKLIKSETITRVFAVSFLLPGFFGSAAPKSFLDGDDPVSAGSFSQIIKVNRRDGFRRRPPRSPRSTCFLPDLFFS